MVDKRMFRNLDYLFMLVVLMILGVSLVVMSTASITLFSTQPYYYVKLQLVWIATGIVLLVILCLIDYQAFRKLSWWLYGLNVVLLLAVLVVGQSAKGASRWIGIGPIAIQPSEFAKVFIIVCFADFIAKRKGKLKTFKDFIPAFLYIGFPMILIILQPDLGTGLVFGAIMIGIMLVGGANPLKLATVFVLLFAIGAGAVFAHTEFGMPIPLKDYQVQRITTFMSPQPKTVDTSANAYQVSQSIVAIGSGGMWGKGYREGTQGQLNFLPEHHTDFVFSIIGEEFGFIGSMTLLFLYLILLLRAIGIAMNAHDQFGALIVTGVVAMMAFHVLVNVGMTSGIMPVTGIPLPLVSYGGSAMWSNLLAIGLIVNVNLRHERLMF